MVQLIEIAIYFKGNKRQRIVPDVMPVMSLDDLLIWKNELKKALLPFVEESEHLKVFITYQNLIDET